VTQVFERHAEGQERRFRRNLLGKRSITRSLGSRGRSALKLYHADCQGHGLELFRPLVIAALVQSGYAAERKGARAVLIERNRPESGSRSRELSRPPGTSNRAPTLHRLGIQAFEPLLIEGSAIQLHPLVTTSFNADFGGDQMASCTLSQKAVQEARTLMLASRNLLNRPT